MQGGEGDTPRGLTAADVVLHPAPAAALAVLVVNDWIVKPRWPGVVSGKASDLAGLFLVPIVAAAVAALARWRPDRAAAVAATVVALGFVAVKVGGAAPLFHLVHQHATADPSDLVTLPAAALGWWHVRRRARPHTAGV